MSITFIIPPKTPAAIPTDFTIDFIAFGGGGGAGIGTDWALYSGGGAGGGAAYLKGTIKLPVNVTHTVTVGAGGVGSTNLGPAGVNAITSPSTNGSPSSIGNFFTATGGGYGGSFRPLPIDNTARASIANGGAGGGGGGAASGTSGQIAQGGAAAVAVINNPSRVTVESNLAFPGGANLDNPQWGCGGGGGGASEIPIPLVPYTTQSATGGSGGGAGPGDRGGGGGGGINGGNRTVHSITSGQDGASAIDFYGLSAALTGTAFSLGVGGTGGDALGDQINAKHGLPGTGIGAGGGGAGWYGGNGGNGSYGGGGGGAADYFQSTTFVGGHGGDGILVLQFNGTNTVVLTSGNSYSIPPGTTSMKAWLIGGGGGGAGATPATDSTAGGAGGAGGMVYVSWPTSNYTGIISYTLGAGGAGGVDSTNGSPGNRSTLNYASMGVIATGGNAGVFNAGTDAPGGFGISSSGTSAAPYAPRLNYDSNTGAISGVELFRASQGVVNPWWAATRIGWSYFASDGTVCGGGRGASGNPAAVSMANVHGPNYHGGGGLDSLNQNGYPGVANTGGGGGGVGRANPGFAGGAGGSGAVMVRLPLSWLGVRDGIAFAWTFAGAETPVNLGGYAYVVFKSSGTLQITAVRT